MRGFRSCPSRCKRLIAHVQTSRCPVRAERFNTTAQSLPTLPAPQKSQLSTSQAGTRLARTHRYLQEDLLAGAHLLLRNRTSSEGRNALPGWNGAKGRSLEAGPCRGTRFQNLRCEPRLDRLSLDEATTDTFGGQSRLRAAVACATLLAASSWKTLTGTSTNCFTS